MSSSSRPDHKSALHVCSKFLKKLMETKQSVAEVESIFVNDLWSAMIHDVENSDRRIADLLAENEELCYQLWQEGVVHGAQTNKDISIVKEGRTPLASISPNCTTSHQQGISLKAPLPLVSVSPITKVCYMVFLVLLQNFVAHASFSLQQRSNNDFWNSCRILDSINLVLG